MSLTAEAAHSLVFQPENWDLIRRLTENFFDKDSYLCEEAIIYVLDQIKAQDWLRIRKFEEQKASFKKFLEVVVSRLIVDFSRKVNYSIAVPNWIRVKGQFGKEAFYLVCCSDKPYEEVKEELIIQGEAQGVTEEEVIVMINELLQTVGIRWKRREVPLSEAQNLCAPTQPPDIAVQSERAQHFVEVVVALLQKNLNEEEIENLPPKVINWTRQLRTHIDSFSSVEFLLLEKIYREGCSVNEAGKQLNLKAPQAHNIHRRLLARLRKVLTQTGILQELESLLQES